MYDMNGYPMGWGEQPRESFYQRNKRLVQVCTIGGLILLGPTVAKEVDDFRSNRSATSAAPAVPQTTVASRVTIPGTNLSCTPELITFSITEANRLSGGVSWLDGLDDHYGGVPKLDLSQAEAYAVVEESAELSGKTVDNPDDVQTGDDWKIYAHCSDGNTSW